METKTILNPPPPPESYQKLTLWVKIISVFLPVAVAILFGIKIPLSLPFDVHILPFINAIINGASTVLLIAALIAIKNKNINLHKKMIYATMFLSVIFLLIYVFYHLVSEPTKYAGEYGMVYFPLLIIHIIAAAIQPPFVLYAFLYAYTNQIAKHKKLVKISYPLWLFVAVSGVACYLMISPFYQ